MSEEIDIVSEIEIAVPRGQVAAFAADPDNATRWREIFKEVKPEHGGPPAVGWRIVFVSTVLGSKLTYAYEVIEHVPGERLVMRTEDGPFAVQTTYAWEDLEGGGTRMTLHTNGAPEKKSLKVAVRMMAKGMQRADRKDLARLKAVLEGAGG